MIHNSTLVTRHDTTKCYTFPSRHSGNHNDAHPVRRWESVLALEYSRLFRPIVARTSRFESNLRKRAVASARFLVSVRRIIRGAIESG